MLGVDSPARPRSARAQFAQAVRDRECALAPSVWDGISAQLAVAAGASALFLTGFGSAAAHGLADLGLINQTEMISHAARIARAVTVPLLMDADDGYGSELNLARTIALVEESKVAGLQIEDQPFPKRSNVLGVDRLLEPQEMIRRLQVALAVRADADLLIVGRTDAVTVLGEAAAFERARSFSDAGVDAVFVSDLHTEGSVDRYAEALPGVAKIWLGDPLTADEMRERGIVLSILSHPMLASWQCYLDESARLVGGASQPALHALLEAQGVLGSTEMK